MSEMVKTVVRRLQVLLVTMLAGAPLMAAETGGSVLWIGTSIPEGCSYTAAVCRLLQMRCQNQSVGASSLCAWTDEMGFDSATSGLSLMMTSQEKEQAFRPYVERGELTEERLDFWKSRSYDIRVLPYIKEADIIVVDHGYNDPVSMEKLYNGGEEGVDWSSDDRTDFVGAFNCLYRLIRENNPDALVIIGGYFQNTCTLSYFKRGIWVSAVLTWMARHYHLPLLDVWNYTDIPDGYMPDSGRYLDELNAKYGTSFKKYQPDTNGNITYFQKFCPDAVHPYSDPSGESDRVLDEVFTLLFSNMVSEGVIRYSEHNGTPSQWYSLGGRAAPQGRRGVYILRTDSTALKCVRSH